MKTKNMKQNIGMLVLSYEMRQYLSSYLQECDRIDPVWMHRDKGLCMNTLYYCEWKGFDSRVHMLMKNWWPCIPGYHHDDVPRTTPTGQPNYFNPEYRSEHLLGLVNGDICPTRFVDQRVVLSDPDYNSRQYEVWHKEIESLHPKTYDAESGKYIQFDCDSFHTGTQAVESGWRWFIRLSRNTSRQGNITNEIRRQVQVYLENPVEGW